MDGHCKNGSPSLYNRVTIGTITSIYPSVILKLVREPLTFQHLVWRSRFEISFSLVSLKMVITMQTISNWRSGLIQALCSVWRNFVISVDQLVKNVGCICLLCPHIGSGKSAESHELLFKDQTHRRSIV